jgi:hypothetical protein
MEMSKPKRLKSEMNLCKELVRNHEEEMVLCMVLNEKEMVPEKNPYQVA